MKNDTIAASLPVGVTTLTFAGLPLQQWVYIVTIAYTLVLIVTKVPTMLKALQLLWKKWKDRNDESN